MTQEPQPGGIVISGGTVRIGALAQGPGARASHVINEPAEPSSQAHEDLAELIRELLDALREHAGELTDDASAQAAAADIATEAAKDRPNVSRIRQLLAKVGAAAGPVSEIAAAIITVERAITGTL